jgi:hypothetical protein
MNQIAGLGLISGLISAAAPDSNLCFWPAPRMALRSTLGYFRGVCTGPTWTVLHRLLQGNRMKAILTTHLLFCAAPTGLSRSCHRFPHAEARG